MARLFLAITVLLTFAGCSNSIERSDEEQSVEMQKESAYFVGTIEEVKDNTALVSAKIVEGNPEGNVFVYLGMNKNESFKVGDEIKVEYDGKILESDPAQINTLSVELVN